MVRPPTFCIGPNLYCRTVYSYLNDIGSQPRSAPPALRGLEPPVEVQGKAVAKRLRGCSALYRFGSRQTPFAAAAAPPP